MRKPSSGVGIIAVMSLLVIILVGNGKALAASNSSQGTGVVTVKTDLLPVYDPYGPGGSQVLITINITAQFARTTPIEVINTFRPTDLSAYSVVDGKSVNDTVSVTSGRYGSFFSLSLSIPANATSFRMRISGIQPGYAFLWRYISNVPSVTLSGVQGAGIGLSYSSYVTLPKGTVFTGAYAQYDYGTVSASPGVLLSTTGNTETYLMNDNIVTVILQSTWYIPGSILIAGLVAAALVLVSLNTFAFGKRFLGRTIGMPGSRPGVVGQKSRRPLFDILRRLFSRIFGLFQPRKLLTLFFLSAFIMVSLGAVAGPYPTVKAYVVAAPSDIGKIHQSLASFVSGINIVTPSQDYSDFEVMSSVSDFDMAVVSNYPSYALPSVGGFILRGLADVPVIVMDNRTNPEFASQIKALYGSRLILVNDSANLTPADQQRISNDLTTNARVRVLGLNVTTGGYKIILYSEGVLSFVLIFFGWAFVGSLSSEARLSSDLSHLVSVISSGIFVFLFSEAIYVTTSILLAFPISLHAVISGAKDVTVVGYLGFGGGSTPRLAAGFLGVFLGIVLTKGAPRVEKTDLAIISGITLFVLADPFIVGQFVFQGLLLFFGNFSIGSAFTSSLTLKGFVYGVGSVFGGSVNPTYLMSAGKMLYFSGLVPIAYLGRMGRTTTTLAALIVSLLVGDGGVRVGEMTPTKSVIAVVPGLMVGFAFLVVLLGLAAAERYIRGSLAR